ncbi:MAG: hypothetical protein FWD58_10330 [Firmicutes bacterium]|nr:hypothetical protein [Bacillota bacterium]
MRTYKCPYCNTTQNLDTKKLRCPFCTAAINYDNIKDDTQTEKFNFSAQAENQNTINDSNISQTSNQTEHEPKRTDNQTNSTNDIYEYDFENHSTYKLPKNPSDISDNNKNYHTPLFNQNEKSSSLKKKYGCIITTVIFLIIGIIITASLIAYCQRENEDNTYTPPIITNPVIRNATLDDITFNINYDFSLSIDIIVTPKVNIDNLEMRFDFYDKNSTLLTSKTTALGNVKKNTDHTIKFTLSEFSLTQLLNITGCSYYITKGTVLFS